MKKRNANFRYFYCFCEEFDKKKKEFINIFLKKLAAFGGISLLCIFYKLNWKIYPFQKRNFDLQK